MASKPKRRFAAILVMDVAEYSRLVESDETAALTALKAHRRELINYTIAEHGGRIFKAAGDGLLAEFPSDVAAVECAAEIAAEIQRGMALRNEQAAIAVSCSVSASISAMWFLTKTSMEGSTYLVMVWPRCAAARSSCTWWYLLVACCL